MCVTFVPIWSQWTFQLGCLGFWFVLCWTINTRIEHLNDTNMSIFKCFCEAYAWCEFYSVSPSPSPSCSVYVCVLSVIVLNTNRSPSFVTHWIVCLEIKSCIWCTCLSGKDNKKKTEFIWIMSDDEMWTEKKRATDVYPFRMGKLNIAVNERQKMWKNKNEIAKYNFSFANVYVTQAQAHCILKQCKLRQPL